MTSKTQANSPKQSETLDNRLCKTVRQLENRLETLCIYVPYVGTCYKRVWFVSIPYPCVKYYRFCF